MRLLLLLLPALLASCSAPGFAKRNPGDPPKMTMEASYSVTR